MFERPVQKRPDHKSTVQKRPDRSLTQSIDAVDTVAAAPTAAPARRGFALADFAITAGRPNRDGLPAELKRGIEALSGYAMDDVRVHRNSSKPAQLQARAFAQGTDIHLAPGQEQHLPHEAWHVVQQKQGRVSVTRRTRDGAAVNDDPALEREADVMGTRTVALGSGGTAGSSALRATTPATGMATGSAAPSRNGRIVQAKLEGLPDDALEVVGSFLGPADQMNMHRASHDLRAREAPRLSDLVETHVRIRAEAADTLAAEHAWNPQHFMNLQNRRRAGDVAAAAQLVEIALEAGRVLDRAKQNLRDEAAIRAKASSALREDAALPESAFIERHGLPPSAARELAGSRVAATLRDIINTQMGFLRLLH